MRLSRSARDSGAAISGLLGLTRVVEMLPRRPSLLVLTYHRVGDAAQSAYDPEVYSATVDAFAAQIAHLKQNFDVIRLRDAIDLVTGSSKARGSLLLITFDDGYLDNFEAAFPVLRSHGVPATFFLPTAYIGTSRIPWWDVIAYAVGHARPDRIRLSYPRPVEYELRSADRSAVVGELLRAYKAPDLADPERFVSGVLAACEVDEPTGRVFMNWAEAAEMLRGGMDIGSHTHNHYLLARLPLEAQYEELRLSRSILEGHLGGQIDSLAYPVGSRNALTYQALEQAGYRIAFSGYGRVNVPGSIDRYEVRRYGVEDDLAYDRFRFTTAVAGLTGRYWL